MTERKESMRKNICIIALLAAAMLAAACTNPSSGLSGTAKSITVVVNGPVDSKTISPSGDSVDITHYEIRVENSTEGYSRESGMITKGTLFNVPNVPAGIWTATVNAYCKNGADSYVLIATATSEEVRVGAGDSATIPVIITDLVDSLSGNITVTLDMPEGLNATGTSFYYTYTITGTGQRADFSYVLPSPASASVGADGTAEILIDSASLNLMQGAYLLTVTVSDQTTEESSSIVKKGVEIMRLLPGLEADGTIQFASDSGSSTGVDITEDIGEIQIEAVTGYTDTGIYMLLKSITEISTDDITIYANGENIADTIIESSIQATEGGIRVEITGLAEGENIITCIVSSGNMIGAVSANIEWPEPPSHFLYTDNGDGSCTITGENPDYPLPSRDNLTIPEEIRGLKVTAIGPFAFCLSTIPDDPSDFTGTLTLPEGLKSIGQAAFAYNSFTGDLVIPASVTTIGNNAFSYNSFTGPLTLPEALQTINEYAFSGNSFTGDLIIPANVTTIGDRAFSDNAFTGTLTLGKSVTTIGSYAFRDNSFTGSLVIPSSVATIGSNAFRSNSFTIFYCEAESQPSGWGGAWNADGIPVTWGYKGN